MLAALTSLSVAACGSPTLPFAPPLTLPKYETLQSRRVRVSIEWGAAAAKHAPLWAEEARHFVKELAPDVKVDVMVLPEHMNVFCMRVDGRVVASSRHGSAYLPRKRIMEAVADARRLNRPPTTVYEEPSHHSRLT